MFKKVYLKLLIF